MNALNRSRATCAYCANALRRSSARTSRISKPSSIAFFTALAPPGGNTSVRLASSHAASFACFGVDVTRCANPSVSALWASITSPKTEHAFAALDPMTLLNFTLNPQLVMIPIFACVSTNFASLEQINTSQANKISNPAFTHAPCATPTIGTAHASIALTGSDESPPSPRSGAEKTSSALAS